MLVKYPWSTCLHNSSALPNVVGECSLEVIELKNRTMFNGDGPGMFAESTLICTDYVPHTEDVEIRESFLLHIKYKPPGK